MKICHFIASSKFGGAERVVINLCNELSKSEEIHLIAFGSGDHLIGLSSRVHLYVMPEVKRYNPLALYRLYRIVSHIEPDIIHTHGAKATRMVHSLRHLLRKPYVATKHNARKGRIFEKVPFVIAVSKRVRETIKHERVALIYNGIEVLPVKSHHVRDDVCEILAVGRLDKIKGFDVLIRACSRLRIPFQLTIVGIGKEKQTLMETARTCGIEHRVVFAGFREDIPQMMQNADVVVISSHSEGFSLVMVEALFYAKVLLSTCVGGAGEILDNRFIVSHENLTEKLEEVAKHYESYLEAFAALSEREKRRFMLSEMATKHLAYYREVIATKKGKNA